VIDKQQIKAVGFDVDGTLYVYSTQATIVVSRRVAETAAKLLKREINEFEVEYLEAREKYRSNTLALQSFGLDGQAIFQKVFDTFPIEQHVGQDAQLIKLIADLKQKYQLFIISNGSGRQVERKLKTLGLDLTDFNPRIYCYDHDWVKPEPAPFLLAIESLQLKPEEIVYVGDREDVDVEGAKAVGMKAILVGGESQVAEQSVQEVYDIGLLLA
jgi:HAD superfamily hydrolase (TIGR01662 family)